MMASYFGGLSDLGGGLTKGMESAQSFRRLALMPEVERNVYEQYASGSPDANMIRADLARIGVLGTPGDGATGTAQVRQENAQKQGVARAMFARAYEEWLPLAGAQELINMGYQGENLDQLREDVASQADERNRLFDEMVQSDADNAAAGGASLMTVTIRQAPRQWAQQRIQSGIQYRRTDLRERGQQRGFEAESRKAVEDATKAYNQITTAYRNETTKANVLPSDLARLNIGQMPTGWDAEVARRLQAASSVARSSIPANVDGFPSDIVGLFRFLVDGSASNISTPQQAQQAWQNLRALIDSKEAIKEEMLRQAEGDKRAAIIELVRGVDPRVRAELVKSMSDSDRAIASGVQGGRTVTGDVFDSPPAPVPSYSQPQQHQQVRTATSIDEF
jgi:hypothetical protein